MLRSFLAFLALLGVASFADAQLQSGAPWPNDHGNASNTGMGLGSGATALLEWTWGTSSDICSAAAIAADGTVYFGDANNGTYELVAVNGTTGVQKWVYPVDGQIESSPAIDATGTIFADSDDGNLYAITDNGTSASLKWTYNEGSPLPGALAIGPAGYMYNVSADGIMHSFRDHAGGAGGVFYGGDANPLCVPPLAANDPIIYFGANPSLFRKFDWFALSTNETLSGLGHPSSEPAEDSNGNVIAPLGDLLWSFSSSLAKNWWVTPASGTVWGPAINSSNTIYAPANNGSTDGLYAYNDSGAAQWNFQSNYSVTAPSVILGSDGTIYFASDQLYCLIDNGSTAGLNWTYPICPNANMAMDASGTLYMPDSVNGGFAAIGNPIIGVTLGSNNVLGGPNSSVSATAYFAAGLTFTQIAAEVNIQSSSPDVQLVNTNIPGGNTWTLQFNTNAVAAQEQVTITVSYGACSKQVILTLGPPSISALTSCTPTGTPATNFFGGEGGQMQIQLSGPACQTGDLVTLSSSSPDVQLPASDTVPYGSGNNSADSFNFTTSAVASEEPVTLTAAFGSSTVQTTIYLEPPTLYYLRLEPNTVVGGQRSAFAVYLNTPAPAGGTAVSLSTSSTDAVLSSNSLTIPQGGSAANVLVHTVPVSSTETITVTATFGSATLSKVLTLTPYGLSGTKLLPTSVMGGSNAAFAVYLNGPAGAGGTTVNLFSSSADATPPASVIVPQGSNAANVAIQTSPVSASEQVTITATFGSNTFSRTLTLYPPSLTGTKLLPTSVEGGRNGAFAVYLNGPAGAGGITLNLSSSSTDVTLPSSVTIPQGSNCASVVVQTAQVVSSEQVTLTASFGSATIETQITLRPVP